MYKSIAAATICFFGVVSQASAKHSDLTHLTVGWAASLSNHQNIGEDKAIGNTFSLPSGLDLLARSQVAGPMCKRIEVKESCN